MTCSRAACRPLPNTAGSPRGARRPTTRVRCVSRGHTQTTSYRWQKRTAATPAAARRDIELRRGSLRRNFAPFLHGSQFAPQLICCNRFGPAPLADHGVSPAAMPMPAIVVIYPPTHCATRCSITFPPCQYLQYHPFTVSAAAVSPHADAVYAE